MEYKRLGRTLNNYWIPFRKNRFLSIQILIRRKNRLEIISPHKAIHLMISLLSSLINRVVIFKINKCLFKVLISSRIALLKSKNFIHLTISVLFNNNKIVETYRYNNKSNNNKIFPIQFPRKNKPLRLLICWNFIEELYVFNPFDCVSYIIMHIFTVYLNKLMNLDNDDPYYMSNVYE